MIPEFIRPPVVYDDRGAPVCTAHGSMAIRWLSRYTDDFGGYYCPECEKAEKASDYRTIYPGVKALEDEARDMARHFKGCRPYEGCPRDKAIKWMDNVARNWYKNRGYRL